MERSSSVLAPVFFGDEFIACGEIIRLLSVTVFFIAWANVIRTQYLIPNKRDSIYLTSTMVTFLTFKDKRNGWKSPTAYVKVNGEEKSIKDSSTFILSMSETLALMDFTAAA